jgi:hypothetical protein
VIVEGMSPALVGIAAGTIAALASARVMGTLVFGVSASDPLTLAAVAATLALVALMASLVPAYRALRLDPVKVLRADSLGLFLCRRLVFRIGCVTFRRRPSSDRHNPIQPSAAASVSASIATLRD